MIIVTARRLSPRSTSGSKGSILMASQLNFAYELRTPLDPWRVEGKLHASFVHPGVKDMSALRLAAEGLDRALFVAPKCRRQPSQPWHRQDNLRESARARAALRRPGAMDGAARAASMSRHWLKCRPGKWTPVRLPANWKCSSSIRLPRPPAKRWPRSSGIIAKTTGTTFHAMRWPTTSRTEANEVLDDLTALFFHQPASQAGRARPSVCLRITGVGVGWLRRAGCGGIFSRRDFSGTATLIGV